MHTDTSAFSANLQYLTLPLTRGEDSHIEDMHLHLHWFRMLNSGAYAMGSYCGGPERVVESLSAHRTKVTGNIRPARS